MTLTFDLLNVKWHRELCMLRATRTQNINFLELCIF